MTNTGESLNIVFMGTPDFAVPALEILNNSKHQIQLVVTVPDKQQGRGRKQQPSAIKLAADSMGLPTSQPESLKSIEFIKTLAALSPDLIVVVAFQILPEEIFSLPRFGSFNLHASLLPKYRGAAPIHWALLNGDKESGVTTFFLKRTVDTGNIILQSKVQIDPVDNLHSLYEKLCRLGADVVLESVNMIASGSVVEGQQDNSNATPAPKVVKETRMLNFLESAERCHNRVRAFGPSPGAFSYRSGILLKIITSSIGSDQGDPGSVIGMSKDSFTIACDKGSLIVSSVQPESKKEMDVASYLRGNPMRLGEQFGR
ncbi:MAG: methionyl-tRNA formyltransferase [Candidatus Marinimicrobia bacterium]|nr:methionyl-tRNA formyltransferase [Candidatus Neomarinimicrobiota bacterium]